MIEDTSDLMIQFVISNRRFVVLRQAIGVPDKDEKPHDLGSGKAITMAIRFGSS